jgi:hypothetical protein
MSAFFCFLQPIDATKYKHLFDLKLIKYIYLIEFLLYERAAQPTILNPTNPAHVIRAP